MPANDPTRGWAVVILAALVTWPATGMANDLVAHVQTVDELMRVENAQLLQKVRGLAAPPAQADGAAKVATRAAPRPLDLQVRAIYGVGRLRADLVVNGYAVEGVPVGATIEACKVVAIEHRCVLLEPAIKKALGACPTRACWTGIDPLAEVKDAAPAAMLPAGVPGMPVGREPAVSRQGNQAMTAREPVAPTRKETR